MKKRTIFLILLFMIMLLSVDERVKAYGVKYEPHTNYNGTFSFIEPTSSDTIYNNWKRAEAYYQENLKKDYDNYVIVSDGGFGNKYGDNQVDLFVWNEEDSDVKPSLMFQRYYSQQQLSLMFAHGKSNYYKVHSFYNTDNYSVKTISTNFAFLVLYNGTLENAPNITKHLKTNQKIAMYGGSPSPWGVFLSVTHNNIIYNCDNILLHEDGRWYDPNNQMVSEYGFVTEPNRQVQSIDVYLFEHYFVREFNFEIKFDNRYDHEVEGFAYYGLVNDNGLYKWERLGIDQGTTVDDYEEVVDEQGYTFKGHALLNYADKYEQIKLSIIPRHPSDFSGTLSFSNGAIAQKDIDMNYFDVKYSRFYNDTALYRYVIFSTKEKKEKDFLYVKKLSSKPLFIDYFDTGLQKFQSYESFYNLGFYSFYRLHYEVGLQNKKGFYILSNEEEKVEYYFYVNDKMYFSLNDDDLLKNSVFIDSTGNKKQDTIEISPDEADHDKYYTDIDLLLEKCQKFIDDLKETSRVFNRCFDVIFQGLPTIVQTFLICLYIIFLSILAFKLGGWSP